MQGFFLVKLAVLHQFQTLGSVLFVLFGLIVQVVADCAFQIYEMILTHSDLSVNCIAIKLYQKQY